MIFTGVHTSMLSFVLNFHLDLLQENVKVFFSERLKKNDEYLLYVCSKKGRLWYSSSYPTFVIWMLKPKVNLNVIPIYKNRLNPPHWPHIFEKSLCKGQQMHQQHKIDRRILWVVMPSIISRVIIFPAFNRKHCHRQNVTSYRYFCLLCMRNTHCVCLAQLASFWLFPIVPAFNNKHNHRQNVTSYAFFWL